MENLLRPRTVPAGDRLVVVATEALPEAAARLIATGIELAISQRGCATVALAGGTTPRMVYRRLAQVHRLPWERIEIYFGDERAVSPDDPQSNYRMARELLFDAVPIPSSHIHRMPAERPDREAAANEYGAELPHRLDLIILGIGEDGHTASLFPGSYALDEEVRKVVAVAGPKPPTHRLTVTPPVITAAATKIVLASGSGKAKAVAEALEGSLNFAGCPAQLARDGIWIMDHAAAAVLRENQGPRIR